MALPKLNTPTFELELPSTKEKIKYRPFLVKEQKVLMMSQETGNNKDMLLSVCEINKSCTFGKIEKPEEMTSFDLEYVFLKIRSKSVGEIANLKILCPDDKKTYADVEVDLSTVDVHVDDEHRNTIVVDEDKKISVLMKYPTLASVDPTKDYSKQDTKALFSVISDGIYQIIEGETIHQAKDYTKEELDKFIESISSASFKKIQKFYETMPKLMHEVEVENPKTKVKSKITLSGLSDFFG